MRLLGSMLCVVALSMVGCTDEVSTGGGQGDGITPEKVSAVNPDVLRDLTKIGETQPANHICEGCVITRFAVENNDAIDEVQVVSASEPRQLFDLDGREFVEVLCLIYKNEDNVIEIDCTP